MVGGRYRLERRIGSGGMSEVWLALDQRLDAPVAVKVMAASLIHSSTLRARFEREARAAAQLRSPHIVAIQALGIEGDVPFMVMELLEGEDLHHRVAREQRLSLRLASQILQQIAVGLSHAHSAGMVDRSLKPSNVFLSRNGDSLLVKIVGRDVDARSDIWSLGAIAFHMITGETPVDEEEPALALLRAVEGQLRSATELVPDLPQGLDAFFERALARRPDDRFQSAHGLVDAFAVFASSPALAESLAFEPTAEVDDVSDEGLETLVQTVPAAPAVADSDLPPAPLVAPPAPSPATAIEAPDAPTIVAKPRPRGTHATRVSALVIAVLVFGLLAAGIAIAWVVVPRDRPRARTAPPVAPSMAPVKLEQAELVPPADYVEAQEASPSVSSASAPPGP
jgi:serine/threonine-protein kinase